MADTLGRRGGERREAALTDSGSEPARRPFDTAATVVFWLMFFMFLFYLLLRTYERFVLGGGDHLWDLDFIVFWVTSKLALAGEANAAFDIERLALETGADWKFRWMYPPGFLVLILPLGLTDPVTAWLLFVLVSAIAFALALRKPAAPLPGGWRLIWASPVILVACLPIGQNSVLWGAALVMALWSLQMRRSGAAGFWLAAMTLKPHLGLLILVALLAARQWAAMAWGVFWFVALTLASTAVFGLDYWRELFMALGSASDGMEDNVFPFRLMTSLFAAARVLEVESGLAVAVHLAGAICICAATAWVWSRPGVSWDLKCATLCAGIPLATPYSFYYDMVVLVVGAMFLWRDGFGESLMARLWLVVLWIGPVVVLYLRVLVPEPPPVFSVAVFSVALMLVTMVVCVLRCRGSRAARLTT